MELRGQTFDESRVGSARTRAQLMIEMANNEPPVTKIDELMQQRDRIPAARDADEIAGAWGKIPQGFQIPIGSLLYSIAHFLSRPLPRSGVKRWIATFGCDGNGGAVFPTSRPEVAIHQKNSKSRFDNE